MPSAKEEKPIRVLDVFCGGTPGMPVLDTLPERYPGRPIRYVGIDREFYHIKADQADHYKGKGEYFTYLKPPMHLDWPQSAFFEKPGQLKAYLASALKDEKFDEIHFHLPNHESASHHSGGPAVLGVLAEFLEPGGKLYHLFERDSPLLNQAPAGAESEKEVPLVFEKNKQLLEKTAKKAGLELHRYAHRLSPIRSGKRYFPSLRGNWFFGKRGKSPLYEAKMSNTLAKIVDKHTDLPEYAYNYAVFRKPREPKISLLQRVKRIFRKSR